MSQDAEKILEHLRRIAVDVAYIKGAVLEADEALSLDDERAYRAYQAEKRASKLLPHAVLKGKLGL
jgi:hypothetical protein